MPQLKCPKCKGRMRDVESLAVSARGCFSCGAGWNVISYPALFHTRGPAATWEEVLSDTEASCFHHPQKKATAHCDACGRFLCPLCEVELARERLCPTCFELRKKDGKRSDLLDTRTRWDQIALACAVIPMVAYPFLPLGVPASFGIILWQMRKRQSLVHRVGFSFFLAFLCAVAASLELASFIFLFIGAFEHQGRF